MYPYRDSRNTLLLKHYQEVQSKVAPWFKVHVMHYLVHEKEFTSTNPVSVESQATYFLLSRIGKNKQGQAIEFLDCCF